VRDFRHIRGGRELLAELQKLPVKLEVNVMRGGMRRGARVIEDEVRRNLAANGSIKSGDLEGTVRSSTRRIGGAVVATVKAGDARAWYWRFVEFGTSAHWIRPVKGASLFIAGVLRKAVHHPGARPKPFMRPAMDSKGPAALDAVVQYARKRLRSGRFVKDWGTAAPEVSIDEG
jgi:HK97 gp10 family phage protein